jgi:hypothetical protein
MDHLQVKSSVTSSINHENFGPIHFRSAKVLDILPSNQSSSNNIFEIGDFKGVSESAQTALMTIPNAQPSKEQMIRDSKPKINTGKSRVLTKSPLLRRQGKSLSNTPVADEQLDLDPATNGDDASNKRVYYRPSLSASLDRSR